MADDVKEMQKKLKEMELKAKLETKAEKRRMKQEKQKMKLLKRQEKMKAKMTKQGRLSPDDLKKMDISSDDTKKEEPGQKIAKAEVVEFKPKEWSRRSVQSMEDVEEKIDRFSGRGVKGLSERYREKYGEDIKVPELYQIETTIEMEKDFDMTYEDDELTKIDKEMEAPPVKEEGGFFGRKKNKTEVEDDGVKIELEPKFLDLSSAFLFLTKKFGAKGGGGKKAILALFDLIILIVLFPITILRILTTIYFVMKRKKEKKTQSVSVAEA